MQRIIVDLPDPDGPQMTMRSPRIDLQIDVAQHMELAVPFVHADDVDGDIGVGDVHLGGVDLDLFRADGIFGGHDRSPCSLCSQRLWPVSSRRSMNIE